MKRRALAFVLFGASGLAACGGSTGGFTSGQPLPIEDLPAKLAESYCAAQKQCAPFFFQIFFADRDCTATATEQFREASFNQLQSAVDAGKVEYDGKLAQQCLTEISEGSCSVLDNNMPDTCRRALTGTVETGGDCDIDGECSGLSRCEITGGACPGKCQPRANAGVACTKDGDCALGLTCAAVTGRCAAPAAEGAPCEGGSAVDCAAGLICIGNDDDQKREGVCKTGQNVLTKKVGEACDLQQGPWCETGLSCAVDSFENLMLTTTCHAPAASGGDCALGIPSECPTGEYCPLSALDLGLGKLKAKCEPLPTEGEACGPELAFTRCAGELVCDTTSKPLQPTCAKLRSLGQTCTGDALCVSGHCSEGACVPESVCAK